MPAMVSAMDAARAAIFYGHERAEPANDIGAIAT